MVTLVSCLILVIIVLLHIIVAMWGDRLPKGDRRKEYIDAYFRRDKFKRS